MRKPFVVLVMLVGLVLAVGGVAGAIIVGPDNVVTTKPQRLDGAAVALTGPAMTAFTNTTLRVTASNAGGTVFIGAAHPVDVRDYARDVTRFSITGAGVRGLKGQVVKGKVASPSGNPVTAAFWTQKVSGTGTRTLDVRLDGSPVQIYAGPVGKGDDLTVSTGVSLANGFVLALGVAVVGLLLLLLGVLLVRRRRRRSDRGVDGSEAPRPGAYAAAGPPASGEPTAPVAGPVRPAPRAARPPRRAALLLLPALALGGCGLAPTRSTAWDGAVSKPALATSEVAAVWAEYDRLNNAAIKASDNAPYSAKGWAAVDAGLTLDADDYITAYNKASRSKVAPAVLTHTGRSLYAPGITGYPAYALSTVTITSSGAKQKPDPAYVDLVLLTRERAAQRWRQAASVYVLVKALPAPLAPGAGGTPTQAQDSKAVTTARAIASYLESGSAKGFAPGADLSSLRGQSAMTKAERSYTADITVNVDLYQNTDHQAGVGGSVRSVRAKGGVLSIASYRSYTVRTAKVGSYVNWRDRPYAEVVNQTGNRPSITLSTVVGVAFFTPDKGTPKVIGVSSDLAR